jgi:hypothetical protein
MMNQYEDIQRGEVEQFGVIFNAWNESQRATI